MPTRSWKEIASTAPGGESTEYLAAVEEGRREAVSEIVAHTLGELRQMREMTQVVLAREMGITQPSLSGLERRSDVQLSTLRDFVEGLGGRLEVEAVFHDLRVPVLLGDSPRSIPTE